ncbi:MAG: hypothetical protein FJY37_03820 [Betaproteobacteria bacterium]|nr:hypothetical protein [Betaproteobacteria bacterium]
MSLKSRLRFDVDQGALYDTDRRYLLMRPDVLMGAVRALPPSAREQFLGALSESARTYVASSLAAYAAQAQGDAGALVQFTVDAARDLGWGLWQVHGSPPHQWLRVRHSPFAQGYGTSDIEVCAPIAGVFLALMSQVLGATVRVREVGCVATGHEFCEFELLPRGS